ASVFLVIIIGGGAHALAQGVCSAEHPCDAREGDSHEEVRSVVQTLVEAAQNIQSMQMAPQSTSADMQQSSQSTSRDSENSSSEYSPGLGDPYFRLSTSVSLSAALGRISIPTEADKAKDLSSYTVDIPPTGSPVTAQVSLTGQVNGVKAGISDP